MLTWVVYDISKDRTRTKIAARCLDFGLQRVQKSVFLGEIPPNRVDEIIQFSLELLNLETDAVYVFPMCRDDFDKVRIVGQGFDRKLVADEVLTGRQATTHAKETRTGLSKRFALRAYGEGPENHRLDDEVNCPD
jgi:CRISPR-associated protein Cas2